MLEFFIDEESTPVCIYTAENAKQVVNNEDESYGFCYGTQDLNKRNKMIKSVAVFIQVGTAYSNKNNF